MFRFVAREEEPVNFRPVPGLETGWAKYETPERSMLWWWLGVIPVAGWISLWLAVTGIVLIGG